MSVSLRTKFLTTAILASLVSATLASPGGTVLTGTVVKVVDGDTVTLSDANKNQHRIRIEAIDAPEKAQAFGQHSKRALIELAAQKPVVATCPTIDRYRRYVCTVRVNGTDVGLEQVRQGLAWHYKRYSKTQAPDARQSYANAEKEAQNSRVGLWSDVHAMPPWEWRKQKITATSSQ